MSEGSKKKVIRTIRSYDEFYNLSSFSLKQAEEQEKYRYYNCMITMVFCAFTLEAYLNQIGENTYTVWNPKDNRLSNNQKLEKILAIRNLKVDKTNEPFSYFGKIFSYRDNIVHCRTQTISNWQKIKQNEIPIEPLTIWEKMTSLEKAQIFHKKTEEMIVYLSKEIDSTDFPLGSPSETMWISN